MKQAKETLIHQFIFMSSVSGIKYFTAITEYPDSDRALFRFFLSPLG